MLTVIGDALRVASRLPDPRQKSNPGARHYVPMDRRTDPDPFKGLSKLPWS